MSAQEKEHAPPRPQQVSLDIVIPVFNEDETLELLFQRLESVFSLAARSACGLSRVRYLFVDDGSRDRSAQIIADRIRAGAPALLLRLSRNFGHQAAIVAGLDHADADLIAVIDADLQDPPEELVPMIAKWRAGFDIVYGVRQHRKENPVKKACYYLFYVILYHLSEGLIPRDSGDFCLLDRRVVEALAKLPERLRFVRGLRAWVGFPSVAHGYERFERAGGMPKYSFRLLYALATDGLTSSSIRPLKVAQVLAIIFFIISGAEAALTISQLLTAAERRPDLILPYFQLLLTSATGFAVLFCLYIMSAYIGRTYLEVKGRPPYVLMETVEPAEPPSIVTLPQDSR